MEPVTPLAQAVNDYGIMVVLSAAFIIMAVILFKFVLTTVSQSLFRQEKNISTLVEVANRQLNFQEQQAKEESAKLDKIQEVSKEILDEVKKDKW